MKGTVSASWPSRAAASLLSAALLALVPLNQAAAAPITSILQIQGGETIDFESPGDLMADQFAGHPLDAQYANINSTIGSFTPWITGNPAAPASGGYMHGAFRVSTTGLPWSQIGASGVLPFLNLSSLDQPSADLTIKVFDQGGAEIGSLTRTFHASPQNTGLPTLQQAFNDATVFVGFASDTPIYAAEFSATAATTQLWRNVTWDNLTFATVPEPSTFVLAAAIPWFVLNFRRRFSR